VPEQESRPTIAELEQEFAAAMATDEFSRYREKAPEIRTDFLARHPALSDILYDEVEELDASRRALDVFPWTRRVVIAAALRPANITIFNTKLLWATAAISLATVITGTLIEISTWFTNTAITAIAFLALSLTLGSMRAIEIRRVLHQKSKDDFADAEAIYSARLTNAARETLRRCVTEVYRRTGVLVFPMTAPTLVELSSGKISASRTHAHVVDFIRHHETSAIGIAGPRGAGKSTLMEAIRNSEVLVSHHVLLTAPVKYDPLDFTRRLFAQVAAEIAKKSGYTVETEQEARGRRFRAQRAMRDMLALAMFAVLAGVIFMWAIDDTKWAWQWQTAVGLAATGLLILVIIAPLLSMLLHQARSSRTGSKLLGIPRSARLAVDALDDLAWSREEGKKESSSIKLLTGLLTLGGEDNVTRKRRERSLPELVADFREMLTQFSRDRKDPAEERFVVFIDELDKLARVDDLTEAVNGIKDLMHIPGVHFVVSVSVDALVQFEQRGMAARDAFDSTFDTVFRMRGLTLNESKDILEGRVANFPTVLTHGCHVWSGGLARDLLRTARRCVEIHRRDGDVARIMRTAVTEDLLALIDNAMKGPGTDGDELRRLGELRQVVLTVADGDADPSRRLPKENGNQVAYVVGVGLALLSCFHGWAPDDPRWERPPEWDDCMEALAEAMAVRAEPPVIRDRALRKAKALVSATAR
jgi:predicted nuclease with RNAse H fold